MCLNFSKLFKTSTISFRVSRIFLLTSLGAFTCTKNSSLLCSFIFTMLALAQTLSCQCPPLSSQSRLVCCSTLQALSPLHSARHLCFPMCPLSPLSWLLPCQAHPKCP